MHLLHPFQLKLSLKNNSSLQEDTYYWQCQRILCPCFLVSCANVGQSPQMSLELILRFQTFACISPWKLSVKILYLEQEIGIRKQGLLSPVPNFCKQHANWTATILSTIIHECSVYHFATKIIVFLMQKPIYFISFTAELINTTFLHALLKPQGKHMLEMFFKFQ